MQERLVKTNIIGPAFKTGVVVLDVARIAVLVEGPCAILELDATAPVSMLAPAVGGAGRPGVGARVGWAPELVCVSSTIIINGTFQACGVGLERKKPGLAITVRLRLRALG